MASAAERKREQRLRDATVIAEAPIAAWTERHCLAVLADPRWRGPGGAMAKGAWEQLGRLRGWL